MDTISPVYARLVLRELERREIDPSPLFARTAVSQHELLRGGDIVMEDFLHILHTGERLLRDEELGFMLGRQMQVLAMGPVGVAIASAPDLRAGVQVLESYTRLHATYVDIVARSTVQGMTVALLYRHDTGYLERFHTQAAVMLLQQYMEMLIGGPIAASRIHLAMPEPENKAAYEDALHGSIRFGAAANEVDIPYRWLDLASPYFHPELWRQAQLSLARDLRETKETEDRPYTQHIVGLLRTSKPPLPDLSDVAIGLNVSQRTLNRRLQGESTSFRQLKSLALARLAKQYLLQTEYSVEAIAEELGYGDTANFRRAFRKSAGCSPAEYRRGRGSTDTQQR